MTQRFYVDATGAYLGSFDGAPPPSGAIEVQTPPGNGADRWNGSAWVPAPDPARYVQAGAARRARRFRDALDRNPLDALVRRAQET